MYNFKKLFSADKGVTSGGSVPQDDDQKPIDNLKLPESTIDEPNEDITETPADELTDDSTDDTAETLTTLIPESAQADIISERISEIYDRLMLDSKSPRLFPKLDQTEIDKIPTLSKKLETLETRSCKEAYDLLSPYVNRIAHVLQENKVFDHSFKNLTSLEPFKSLENNSKINLRQICYLLKIRSNLKDGTTPNFETLMSLSYDDISKLLESIYQFLIYLKDRSNLNNFSISSSNKESLNDLIKNLENESNKDILTRKELNSKIFNRLSIYVKEGDLTPEELKIFEKLKLISYLEAIINHADQLASQIRDLYVKSFSTEPEDIDDFNDAVSRGLELINTLYETGNPRELDKKYLHYLNVADTNPDELIERIQKDLLTSLKSIEKLMLLIEKLLTDEELDQNFNILEIIESVDSQNPDSAPLDVKYMGTALDPETNEDYRLSIFARPQEYTSKKTSTQRNQARIKLEFLSKGDATKSSTRIDLSPQGVELDLDFLGAIFIEQENPNSMFAYHYYIDDQISQNMYGMDLPKLPILINSTIFKKIVELFISELKRRDKSNLAVTTENVNLVN